MQESLVEAIVKALRDNRDGIENMQFAEIVIKIQDGCPVFMFVTKNYKLS